MQIDKSVALVTGGSRGIGAATARRLATEGWDVAVTYRSGREDAERVVADLCASGARAAAFAVDVRVPDEVSALIASVERELGTVRGLVANAGLNRRNVLVRQTVEEWEEVIGIDLTGTFLCAKAVVPGMLAAGGGSIVCVSSIAGVSGGSMGPAYAAAKGGVISLVRYLGRELTRQGVRANAVAPILTATEMIDDVAEEERARIVGGYRLGRIVRSEEVADVIAYLLGPNSSAVTGEVIPIGA